MKALEQFMERFMFASRWLLAPFYLGMVLAIVLLLMTFMQELFYLIPKAFEGNTKYTILGILQLIDIAFIANLLLIIIFSGYENFVSKMDTAGHEDRPSWMGHVGFSDLKLKLIGSIVAISAIELLKAMVNIDKYTNYELGWLVGIHITFVFSGVMFAVMDRLGDSKKAAKKAAE